MQGALAGLGRWSLDDSFLSTDGLGPGEFLAALLRCAGSGAGGDRCAGSLEGPGRRLGGLPQGFQVLVTCMHKTKTYRMQEPLMHLKTWGWPWVSHWHEQRPQIPEVRCNF